MTIKNSCLEKETTPNFSRQSINKIFKIFSQKNWGGEKVENRDVSFDLGEVGRLDATGTEGGQV